MSQTYRERFKELWTEYCRDEQDIINVKTAVETFFLYGANFAFEKAIDLSRDEDSVDVEDFFSVSKLQEWARKNKHLISAEMED